MSAESTAVVRAVGNLIIPGSGLERLGSVCVALRGVRVHSPPSVTRSTFLRIRSRGSQFLRP